MLQEICEHIHNYFVSSEVRETFTVSGGVISPALSLKDGQRFLIVGSDLNDGVYTYHAYGITDDDDNNAAGLRDETFAGTICAMAVPPAVITLSAEINQWVENNATAIESPYQSENVIGVYSYTKASGGSGAGGSIGWQDIYKSRLNRWRRVSF